MCSLEDTPQKLHQDSIARLSWGSNCYCLVLVVNCPSFESARGKDLINDRILRGCNRNGNDGVILSHVLLSYFPQVQKYHILSHARSLLNIIDLQFLPSGWIKKRHL